MNTTRRSLLGAFLTGPFAGLGDIRAIAREMPGLSLTPACDDGDEQTLEREAGPFFKPAAPLNRNLYRDAPAGERITVAGFVVDDRCRPVPGSLLEIWHADENGDYDSEGFRLRGHQFADKKGRWWFNTIIPALYPGRTRHFHFKVQRPGGNVLITQLFFPSESRNARDHLFDETLLMKMSDAGDGRLARFDFIV